MHEKGASKLSQECNRTIKMADVYTIQQTGYIDLTACSSEKFNTLK